jgi:hypothetical protein
VLQVLAGAGSGGDLGVPRLRSLQHLHRVRERAVAEVARRGARRRETAGAAAGGDVHFNVMRPCLFCMENP